jgi:hypothetical protein
MFNPAAKLAVMMLIIQKNNKDTILKIKMLFKKKITRLIKIMIKI